MATQSREDIQHTLPDSSNEPIAALEGLPVYNHDAFSLLRSPEVPRVVNAKREGPQTMVTYHPDENVQIVPLGPQVSWMQTCCEKLVKRNRILIAPSLMTSAKGSERKVPADASLRPKEAKMPRLR